MYIVIEMQTNDGVTAVVPPAAYADRNQAESKFHTVLAAAAVSEVEIHSCAVLDERGVAVLNGVYYHLPEPEPEPEPEIPAEEDEPEVPAEEEPEEEPEAPAEEPEAEDEPEPEAEEPEPEEEPEAPEEEQEEEPETGEE